MNKDLFKYLLKFKKGLFIFFGLINLLELIIIMTIENTAIDQYAIGLVVLAVTTIVMAFANIPLIFNFVHNKKAVDSYFALPLERKELLITSLVFACFILLVPYLSANLILFIITKANKAIIEVGPFLMVLFICTLGIIILNAFNTTVFTIANSLFDGIVLMLSYTILPFIIYLVIMIFEENFVYGFYPFNAYEIISHFSLPTKIIGSVVELIEGSFKFTLSLFVCFAFHIIASVIGLKNNFINRQTERAETISGNFFAYPFIIDAYVILLIFGTSFAMGGVFNKECIVYFILLFICYIVANFVYRRKLTIKPKDTILFVIVVVLALAFGKLSLSTNGFNLAYAYDKSNDNLVYNFSKYIILEEESKESNEISKLIKEKYPYMYCYEYNFHFDLKKVPEPLKIKELMEKKREEAIEHHYDFLNHKVQWSYNGNLSINERAKNTIIDENTKFDSFIQNYNYNLPYPFTLEELKMLDEWSGKNNEIFFRIDSVNDYEEVTLKEILAK